jgi:hypothetical protein
MHRSRGCREPKNPMPRQREFRFSRLELISGAAVLTALVVLVTLIVSDLVASGDSLPPGCSQQDRSVPGCRPVGTQRLTQSSITLATVVLTTVGAVFVAILTARTTDRRQERALQAEEDRHKDRLQSEEDQHAASLEAERERHEAQLKQERELAEVASLRLLVDGVSAHLAELVHHATRASALQETNTPAGGGEVSYDADEWRRLATEEREALHDLFERMSPTVGNTALLASRLGGGHELVQEYTATTDALRRWREAAATAAWQGSDRDIQPVESLYERAVSAYVKYTHALTKVIGTTAGSRG